VGDHAELGRKHDLAPAAFQGFTKKQFVLERPVYLRAIKVSHPQFQRTVNRADRVLFGLRVAGVDMGHSHAAKSDRGDGKVTKFDVLHKVTSGWARLLNEFTANTSQRFSQTEVIMRLRNSPYEPKLRPLGPPTKRIPA
jgi:hypothetical protein